MPIAWRLDVAAGLLLVEYSDPYSFEEWRDVIDGVRREPLFSFQRQIGVSVDWTRVGAPSALFNRSVAAYLTQHPVMLKGRRVAFVTGDEESLAAARTQAMAFEDAGAMSAVFQSAEMAHAWLREP
jgi:hypothetical protein